MRFGLVLLAALPSALAATAYKAPAALLAKVAATDDCELPSTYHVKHFGGKTHRKTKMHRQDKKLASYDFTFVDTASHVTTLCQFNSSSVPATPSGPTPRYACDNRAVEFIWEDGPKELTLIERVCPNAKGMPKYEAAGSIIVPLSCSPVTDRCVTNSTDFSTQFFSLEPVAGPTALDLQN